MSKAAALDPKDVTLHLAGQLTQSWEVRLPAGVSFSDILVPGTWTEIEKLMRSRGGGKRPKAHDLLRRVGSGFDAMCLVVSVGDGYSLEFYCGKRPSSVAQVLDDLDALPDTGSSAELKEQAKTLRKRWAAAGVSREDIGAARRAYAKTSHPDAGAVDGQRLAAANAILDAALASMQEAA
jgi:hypothetical protein